jgi:multiple sugar transport system ATP-binding protein
MYERPANRFVAQFIGAPAMNLLPAAAAGVAAPAGAIAGVRPHDLEIGEGGPLHATVTLVEPRGADFVVHLQPQSGGVEPLIAVVARRPPPVGGEPVRVTLPAGRVHLFDGATGRRLD